MQNDTLEEKTRKRLFCYYYSMLGNASEAARKAGWSKIDAARAAAEILLSAQYRRLIESLRSRQNELSGLVEAGLKRLAFGSAADAALLVFGDEAPSEATIAGMELFNVSEMKRVKGGGVEIKLFDRQKALEKLYEYASAKDTDLAAAQLIEALGQGADGGESDD